MIKLHIAPYPPAPAGWRLVRTITEAVRAIDTGYVTEVSLARGPIGYFRTEPARDFFAVPEETFEPVERFIARLPESIRPVCRLRGDGPSSMVCEGMQSPARLFVDDLRDCPDGWELIRTITEAVRILDAGGITEISLDHDAGYYRPSQTGGHIEVGEETFDPIARFIVRLPPDCRPSTVNIHSANDVGRDRMTHTLRGTGVIVTHRRYGEI